MTELDKQMQALVESARGVAGPSDATKARIRLGVSLAPLSSTPATSLGTGSPAAASKSSMSGHSIMSSALGKVMVAVVAVGGVIAVVGPESEPTREPNAAGTAALLNSSPANGSSLSTEAVDVPVEREAEPRLAPPESVQSPVGDGEVVRPVAARRKNAESRPVAERSSPTRRAVAGRTVPDELALIALARTQTKRGEFSKALQLLEDHAARFAKGELVHESDLLRVLCLCGVGRVDEARVVKRRLVETAGSVYASSRLQGTCVHGHAP